ncbi:MAG TPA: helix-turn-helix transcriptional regulator [Clostridiaceae bacterium]|nr:helix-turn-helix transcriptional regulator [Clostridiaceae bacterium]
MLKNYFSNLHVNLIVAAFTKCPLTWRDIDYIPDYNKFYFICDGEGMLKIGDQEFYPKPGQFCLMPAGIKQSYSCISSNTFLKYWCHFTAKIGEVNIFDIIKTPLLIDVKNKSTIESLFRKLIYYYNSSELTSSLYSQSTLTEIIAFFLDSIPKEKIIINSSSTINKLEKILSYIENNICEDINIKQLAEMTNFHPNYFIRFFKKNTGFSPAHYINRLKMEKAKSLLILDDMNITRISETLGFKDIYHFSRTFKNYTGFSPTEYRKVMLRQGD